MQPSILQSYEDESGFSYLKDKIVPHALETTFNVKLKNNYFKIEFDDSENTEFYDEYDKLRHMTEDLYKEYKKILEQYRISGEIYYSKSFLNLNESCGSKRRKLENEYPILKTAYSKYNETNIETEYGLVFDNSVGTGITHIQKFYTIDLYLNEVDIDPTKAYMDLKIFYNSTDELFYIETNNHEDAIGCAHFIEKSINKSKDANIHIGRVTINPKYQSIKFKGDLTEITYTIVYPNGDEPGERHDILKESKGKQKTTTIYGTRGEPLRNEPITEEINKEAKDGYLSDLFAKGAKTVKKILKVGTLPDKE